MRKRIVSGIMLTLLLTSMIAWAFEVQLVKGSGTIYIRADGSIEPLTANITSVDNVTYYFTDNNYDEIVVERSDIVIDGDRYVLQGFGSGNGFTLSDISNVTIRNTDIKEFMLGIRLGGAAFITIHNNNITNNGYDPEAGTGVFAYSSHNNYVFDNLIANNGQGISLTYSDNNTISGNNITNNLAQWGVTPGGYGVGIGHSNSNVISRNMITANNRYGVQLHDFSNYNNIADNIISSHNDYGIMFIDSANYNSISGNNITKNLSGLGFFSSYGTGQPCDGNVISGNNITNNLGMGIWVQDSSKNNILHRNNIINNSYGIGFHSAPNNKIYHNNFVNNSYGQVYGYANFWDDGYPSGGNYWSDYTGADLYSGPYRNESGSDGIGDTHYVIDVNNKDNYPLMQRYHGPVRNLNTGESYPTIQKGINNASNGDRILVLSGTYNEHVIVDKPVSLIGEDKSTTIIDGNGIGTVVTIIQGNVNITGFTIKESGSTVPDAGIKLGNVTHCEISGNNIAANGDGIYLDESSDYNSISGNQITDNGNGIVLAFYSNYNTISGNNITENSLYGIRLSVSNIIFGNNIRGNQGGIFIGWSSNNTISGNNVTENDWNGIRLYFSSNNTISGNNLSSNLCGIDLELSSNNTISGNNIANNSDTGIVLEDSSHNSIYHNNFINNTKQVRVTVEYTNVWDDGYPSGGNYWSDHNSPDIDGDGIGDTPCVIDENNRDRYPLIYTYGFVPSPDLNDDRIVDINDLIIWTNVWGSQPGYPNWSPYIDLNQDGIADIFDLVIIAVNYGKAW